VEEQQAPHETNEQYEERVMNKRANQLYHTIKTRFAQKDTLVFDDLTYRNRRKEVYFYYKFKTYFKFNKFN
jgi:cohesin complex subunit SCC1